VLKKTTNVRKDLHCDGAHLNGGKGQKGKLTQKKGHRNRNSKVHLAEGMRKLRSLCMNPGGEGSARRGEVKDGQRGFFLFQKGAGESQLSW